jgi:anionic cell wall polymer biosynthesis LytR-Cps2A-Psr (LCP) family protein
MARRSRKKTSLWKNLRAKFRLRRKLRIFLLSFITVVATASILSSMALLNFFKAPLAEARGGADRKVDWSGEEHINLALVVLDDLERPEAKITKLHVLSIEPSKKQVAIVNVPTTLIVDIPLGFGERAFSEVYALGGSVAPESNISLLLKTIERHLNIPVDGYLVTDTTGEELLAFGEPLRTQLESRWERSFNLLKNVGVVRQYVRTNLTFKELVRLVDFFWKARSEKILTGEWSLENGYSKSGLFCEQEIEGENLRIMVLNGTMRGGLAGEASEIIGCLGGNVVEVDNDTNQHRLQSVLFTSDSDAYTVQRLVSVLDISAVQLPPSDFYKRSDIVVVLGEDYGR